ncbi:MAG: NlpC/P60 family protein [Coriobacteriia bacterium]|nr:NlpC/P60 family protein [Coriobacteriia bacterium]
MNATARHDISFARALSCVIVALFIAAFPSTLAIAAPFTESLNDGDYISYDAQTMLDMASDDQRAALEAYLLEVAEIDLETQIAVELYNDAQSRLDAINSDIAQKELDLEALNKAYSIQARQLADRAVMHYKGGDLALIEILLDATSVQNLIQRFGYLKILNINDSSQRERIGQEKAALQASLTQLLIDRDEAASLTFELKARKIEIETRNKQRTDALVEENTELADLVAAYYAIEDMREARYNVNVLSAEGDSAPIAPDSPAETALAYRGVPYVWGGADKSGFDGPGFVQFVFAQHGVILERSASAQVTAGAPVSLRASLLPGDAVFFGNPIRHVGIYLGNGYFIHAPNTGDVVKVSTLSERDDYAGARRYSWAPRTVDPL